MPEVRLTAASPLSGLAVPGRFGAEIAEPGVFLTARTGLSLASVMARRGALDDLVRRVRDAFGIELPAHPRRHGSGSLAFAWAGPGHWLAILEGAEVHGLVAVLRTELAGLVSVSDQTDGRVVVRIGGPKARDTLAKGLPIDLHPRAFRTGDSAVSVIGHIGIHLWQLDDRPSFETVVATSYARSYWQSITTAAAEFGVVVETEDMRR